METLIAYYYPGPDYCSSFMLVSYLLLNPLSVNLTKWLYTLKQFVGKNKKSTICLSVFEHFLGLMLKGLNEQFLKDFASDLEFRKTSVWILINIWKMY